MTDNVAVTPGTGATIATDDIAGAQYQRVKLIHGADGVNAGDVSTANGLPVNVVAGSAAGTQYTEGDVDASITGTAVMWEDGSNTLRAVSESKPLPVQGSVIVSSANNVHPAYGMDITATDLDDAFPMGFVRDDALATLSIADGNYAHGRVNARGAHWVAIENGSGGQITSFGGGTQYTEGDTDASITGNALMYETAANTLAVVGETQPLPVFVDSINNTVFVSSDINTDAPYSLGNAVMPAGAVRDDAPTTLTEVDGDFTILRTDSTGALWVKHSGTIAATQSGTWNVGTVTALTDITNWGNIVDNAQFTDGTTRLLPAGYIFDETAGTSLTENDAAAARIDSKRAQVFTIEDATTRGRRTTVSAGGALLTDASATTQPVSQATASSLNAQVVGNIANGSSDSGNPVKFGGVGRTANPTAVTDGQRVNASFDDLGRQVVCVGQVRDLITDATTTIASSNTETTILAQAASTFHDIVLLVLTNASATAVSATIKESTGGTTRMIVDLAANGGAVIPFPRPMKQGTVNNNWTCTLSSASVTVHIYVQAEKNV